MEYSEYPQIMTVSNLTDERRATFYRKTYTHVALAVLLFIITEILFFQSPVIVNFAASLIGGWSWLILLGVFMFVTNYAENLALKSEDKNTHYLALGIYVVAEAFIFIPMLLFAGLSTVVFVTKKDFSFLKSILAISFFIALGLIIAGTIFGFDLGLWFSVGMIVLAAGSILYTTSNMVHKYHEEQYVAAALGLFASLMLLFWYILRIFMSRD